MILIVHITSNILIIGVPQVHIVCKISAPTRNAELARFGAQQAKERTTEDSIVWFGHDTAAAVRDGPSVSIVS